MRFSIACLLTLVELSVLFRAVAAHMITPAPQVRFAVDLGPVTYEEALFRRQSNGASDGLQNCDGKSTFFCPSGTCYTGVNGYIGCCTGSSCDVRTTCQEYRSNVSPTCDHSTGGCVTCSDSKNPFCVVITNIEEDQFINYCGPTRTTQTVSYENLVTTGSTAGFPPTTTTSTSSSPDSSSSTDSSSTSSSTTSADTAAASAPSPSDSSDDSDVGQGSHLSTGAAVGIAVAAGAVAIILVLLLLWFVIRPRRQRAQIASAIQPGTEKTQSVTGISGPPHWMSYSGPVISEADSRPTAAPVAELSPMPSTFSDPTNDPRLSISADRAVGGIRKVRSAGSLVRPHDEEEETLAQRRARLYKQGTTSTDVSPVTPAFLPEADSRPTSSGPSQASPHHMSGVSSLTSGGTYHASSPNVSPNPSTYIPYSPHWSTRQQRGSTSTGAGGYLSAEDAMIPGRYWEAENGVGQQSRQQATAAQEDSEAEQRGNAP